MTDTQDTQDKDRLADAKAQGQAQFDSIREMLTPDWEAIATEAGWEPYTDKFGVACWRHVADDATFAGTARQLCEFNEIEEGDDAADERRQRIYEDALSVEVRSGWYSPGACDADTKPAEYRILLCTGGPACQIVGELSEYGEPETARLQVQDWFTPWTDFYPATKIDHDSDEIAKGEEILLEYARCFYFGE